MCDMTISCSMLSVKNKKKPLASHNFVLHVSYSMVNQLYSLTNVLNLKKRKY